MTGQTAMTDERLRALAEGLRHLPHMVDFDIGPDNVATVLDAADGILALLDVVKAARDLTVTLSIHTTGSLGDERARDLMTNALADALAALNGKAV